MDAAVASVISEKAAPSKDETLSYRPDVDGLRALAIVAVIAFHVSPKYVPGGYIGVDVFFVISGYLISGIILRALQRRVFSCTEFYARRIRRIFPALIVVLLTVCGVGWLILLPDEYQILGKEIAVGAGFLTNWSLYQDFEWYFGLGANPLIHLWSLGVEEQFYLLWPLLLLLIWKLTKRRGFYILLVTLVSFCLNVTAARSDLGACFYLPWNRLWELSLGGVFAYGEIFKTSGLNGLQSPLAVKLYTWFDGIKNTRAMIGFGLICWSVAFLSDKLAFPGWWALAPALGTLLLISAGPSGWISSVLLSSRWVVFVGLISYPLYLFHWPLLSFAHILLREEMSVGLTCVLLLVAFILAVITYRYVELPIRRLVVTTGMVSSLCAAMLGCLSVGLVIFAQMIPARSHSYNLSKFVAAAAEDWLPDHHAVLGTQWNRRAQWTWYVDGLVTVGKSPRQVVFIGDSNMQQYYLRIAKIVSEHPTETHSAVFSVGAGCGPAVMEILKDIMENPDVQLARCRNVIKRGIEYARKSSVDAVVLSAQWYLYLVNWTDGGKIDTDGVLNDLGHLIGDFVGEGKRVYVILNIPRGGEFDPRLMIQRSLFPLDFKVHVLAANRSEIERRIGPTNAKVRQIAESAGATVIDPVEFLCNAKTCPALSVTGEPMYKDFDHLRPSYVRDHVSFIDRTVWNANSMGEIKGVNGDR